MRINTTERWSPLFLGLFLAAASCSTVRQSQHDQVDLEAARVAVIEFHREVVTYLSRVELRELPTWEEIITPGEGSDRWLTARSEWPKDPWGHELEIRDGSTPLDFEVISYGPDGIPDTDDDVSSKRIL